MAEPNRLAAALSYEQDRPAFGNPSMLEQGRKMRERKQAEQVERSAQNVKSDLLARALMYRYNPETLTGLTDTPGPQTLDEAAGLNPRVDRSTFLPYSQKEGLHVPAVAADLMKLATASNPQYSNLMQPEEAMPLATNMMGGGVVASRLAPAPAGSLGMNVWHGTPHRFPPTAKNPLGEFDPTKIGTGEGAQAYGVGAAYLAEAKDLAKHYRDVLAIDPRDSVNSVRAALSPTGRGQYWGAGENRAKLDDIYFEMQRHPNLQPYLNDSAFKKDIQKIIDGTNPDGTVTDEAINILRRLDKTMPKPSGQLYKVDLADEQIPKMLDWDKPLKEQKPILDLLAAKLEGTKVGDALGVYKGNIPLLSLSGGNMAGATPASAIGRDFLRHLGDIARKYDGNELNQIFKANGGKQDAAVSQFLQQNGITGIKYLDAGSRGAGEGTRNFIPFDPEHAKIIGRE